MKQISKTFTIFFVFFWVVSENGTAQKLVVNFEISNYKNDTLIVGNYFHKTNCKRYLLPRGKANLNGHLLTDLSKACIWSY